MKERLKWGRPGNEARTLVFALFTNPSSLVPSLLCDGTVDGTQEPGNKVTEVLCPDYLSLGCENVV